MSEEQRQHLLAEYDAACGYAQHTETVAWAVGALFVPASLTPFAAIDADTGSLSALGYAFGSVSLYTCWWLIHERMRVANRARFERIYAIEAELGAAHHTQAKKALDASTRTVPVSWVWRGLGLVLIVSWLVVISAQCHWVGAIDRYGPLPRATPDAGATDGGRGNEP